jgi:transcriptional regulator with XRE-family HTH domain
VGDINRQIGNRIRKLRKGKGLSQEDLGAKADLHYTYIGAVERGEKNCSIKTLEKIADALNTNLPDLVNVSRKPKENQKIKEALITDLNSAPSELLKLIHELIREIKALKTGTEA